MEAVNHSGRAHALLSASGAHRWLECTPSARFEEQFAQKTSPFAEEGTLAHEFAELGVRYGAGLMTKREHSKAIDKLRRSLRYTDDMEEEVAKHVDYVLEQYHSAKTRTEGAVLAIESRLDMTDYIENGFGTGDDLVIADGVMEVIDLKYGKGIRVSAENNPQLMLYGLGALRDFSMLYDIHEVKLTIVQPRLDSISSWSISVEDLYAWGEKVVKPKAQKAYEGLGDHVPGEWCRFCRAKTSCKALAEENLSLAKLDFEDLKQPSHLNMPKLSDDDILNVYEKADQIQDWLSSIKAYVLDEAIKGRNWDGFKLVEGRSNRKIKDEKEFKEALLERGLDESAITQTKLLSLTAIEKIVGKKVFAEELSDYVIKPQGAPTLVPLSDKRPEFSSVEADFLQKD